MDAPEIFFEVEVLGGGRYNARCPKLEVSFLAMSLEALCAQVEATLAAAFPKEGRPGASRVQLIFAR